MNRHGSCSHSHSLATADILDHNSTVVCMNSVTVSCRAQALQSQLASIEFQSAVDLRPELMV